LRHINKTQTKIGRIRYSARKEILEQNRLRSTFERRLNLQLLTEFAKIGKAAQNEYEASNKVFATSININENFRKILRPHYRAVIEKFGLRIFENLKNVPNFEFLIQNYVNEFGAIAIANISKTTRLRIVRIIAQMEREGAGTQEIGRAIYNSQRGAFPRYRAATIARTETHSAASYANHEVAKGMNITDLQKQWVSVSDSRTRSHHSSLNGTRIPMDEDFVVNVKGISYSMSKPSDPRGGAVNNINCRCVLLYVSPEDDVIDE